MTESKFFLYVVSCFVNCLGDEELFFIITASCPPSCSSQPGASYSVPVFRLMFHLLVGTPYLVSTILLGLIYRDRKKGRTALASV